MRIEVPIYVHTSLSTYITKLRRSVMCVYYALMGTSVFLHTRRRALFMLTDNERCLSKGFVDGLAFSSSVSLAALGLAQGVVNTPSWTLNCPHPLLGLIFVILLKN